MLCRFVCVGLNYGTVTKIASKIAGRILQGKSKYKVIERQSEWTRAGGRECKTFSSKRFYDVAKGDAAKYFAK